MPLTYRRMTPADFPACARELIAAFAEKPWSEVWTYEQAYDRIEEIMSPASAEASSAWTARYASACSADAS